MNNFTKNDDLTRKNRDLTGKKIDLANDLANKHIEP